MSGSSVLLLKLYLMCQQQTGRSHFRSKVELVDHTHMVDVHETMINLGSSFNHRVTHLMDTREKE